MSRYEDCPHWPWRSDPSSLGRKSDLAANVEEVVLCLVHRMYCDPPQRALASLWVVVNNCAIPVVGGQSGGDIAEHLCPVPQLGGPLLGLRLGIPVVHDPLVTSRRGTVRLIHAAGRKYPLTL